MKVRELIAGAEKRFADAGIEDYKSDAWLLFEHIFQINRGKYFMIMNDDVENALQDCEEALANQTDGQSISRLLQFEEAVTRRCERIPLQHITGYQEFMGLGFKVNEHVLTPRPETELLVEQTLKACEVLYGKVRKEASDENLYREASNGMPVCDKEYGQQKYDETERSSGSVRVLDMCTGSGCIAISVKKLSKVSVEVAAVDLSEEALETARENANMHNCEIRFTQSDLFDKIVGETFDIIVSNPPYICSAVIPTLMKEVREHEPMMALDGAEDGLKFYRIISAESCQHLTKGGRILYEIGYDQGETVAELLKEYGYSSIEVIKDYAGLDRMVTAIWLPEMEE